MVLPQVFHNLGGGAARLKVSFGIQVALHVSDGKEVFPIC